MSQLIVITFDNADEAGKVRDAIHRGEKGGRSAWTILQWSCAMRKARSMSKTNWIVA